MVLTPVSIIASSFAVFLVLLALTPLLRHTQRLLITVGFSLTAIASFLATCRGCLDRGKRRHVPAHYSPRASRSSVPSEA